MTTLPEEAVKAAREVARSHYLNADDWMRAALTAALPHLPGVGVKKLEWEPIDGGNAFRASALVFGWIRIESYTIHNWQVQWSVPGICNILLPSVFSTPDEAKAAAQADYEARILSALEPSAARELALEEGFRHGVEAAANRCELSAALSQEQQDKESNPFIRNALMGEIATAKALAKNIRALSSPDHNADAGKVEGDGWLPIESAPKDGTIVLLGWHDPDIEEIGAVAGWYEGGPTDRCWYDQYHEPVTATHWMPLRPLPSAPSQEVAGS